MSKKDKGRLPQFVPLLHLTIKTPAWLAMSHGAKGALHRLEKPRSEPAQRSLPLASRRSKRGWILPAQNR